MLKKLIMGMVLLLSICSMSANQEVTSIVTNPQWSFSDNFEVAKKSDDVWSGHNLEYGVVDPTNSENKVMKLKFLKNKDYYRSLYRFKIPVKAVELSLRWKQYVPSSYKHLAKHQQLFKVWSPNISLASSAWGIDSVNGALPTIHVKVSGKDYGHSFNHNKLPILNDNEGKWSNMYVYIKLATDKDSYGKIEVYKDGELITSTDSETLAKGYSSAPKGSELIKYLNEGNFINEGILFGGANGAFEEDTEFLVDDLEILAKTAQVVGNDMISESGNGNKYYVDINNPNASDENPGTQEFPWKTFLKASNSAQAGDTVYVMPGIYEDSTPHKGSGDFYSSFIPANSGTEDNPITFKSVVPKAAVLKASITDTKIAQIEKALAFVNRSNIIYDGFKTIGMVHIQKSHRINFINGEITVGSLSRGAGNPSLNWGIGIQNSSNCVIRNNKIHKMSYAIKSTGEKWVKHNQAGIMMFGGKLAPTKNNLIEYNYLDMSNPFYDPNDDNSTPINVYAGIGHKGGNIYNNVYKRNFIKNAIAGIFTTASTNGELFVSNEQYLNNVLVNNTYGVELDNGSIGAKFINNTIVNSQRTLSSRSLYKEGKETFFNKDIEFKNNIVQNNKVFYFNNTYSSAYVDTDIFSIFKNIEGNQFFNINTYLIRKDGSKDIYTTLGEMQENSGFSVGNEIETSFINPIGEEPEDFKPTSFSSSQKGAYESESDVVGTLQEEHNTYYVSKSGNDSSNCTKQQPCLTIQKGFSVLTPGDTLNIGEGIYSDIGSESEYYTKEEVPRYTSTPVNIAKWLLAIDHSGTKDNPITIQADPENTGKVILDGKHIRNGNQSYVGGIAISHNDYIHFKNFTIRNVASEGIYNWDHIYNTNRDRGATEDPNKMSYGVHIEGMTIHHIGGGDNDAGIGMWSSKNWVVKNNHIYDVYGIPTKIPGVIGKRRGIGIQSYGTINALVTHNLIENVADGIYWKDHYILDFNTREPVFESEISFNKLINVNFGIRVCVQPEFEAGENYIHHNIIKSTNTSYGESPVGIRITMSAVDYPTTAPQRIENNLIYGSNSSDSKGILLAGATDVRMKGNIILKKHRSIITNKDKFNAKITYSDYNIFNSSPKFILDRSPEEDIKYESLSEWQKQEKNGKPLEPLSLNIDNPDTNSITSIFDNMFENEEDFTYKTTSPAIGFMEDGSNAGPYQYGNEVIGLE